MTETFDPKAIDLSEERVNALLDEAVAEKGADYVYPRAANFENCVNAELIDGKIYPSCIVGNVLHRAGVPLELLWGNAYAGSDTLLNTLGLDDSPGASQRLLHRVQERQDCAVPWGKAVEQAREYVRVTAMWDE